MFVSIKRLIAIFIIITLLIILYQGGFSIPMAKIRLAGDVQTVLVYTSDTLKKFGNDVAASQGLPRI